VIIQEEPANGLPMGFLPHLHPLGLGEIRALVTAGMAGVAHARTPKIVRFHGPPFSIPELVRVSGDHRAVLNPADLAGRFSQELQQPFVAVDHRITYFMGLSLIVEILPSALNSFRTRSTLDSDKM
jgi:hypothetical protein